MKLLLPTVLALLLAALCASCVSTGAEPVRWLLCPASDPEPASIDRFRVVGVASVPSDPSSVGLRSPIHYDLDFSTPSGVVATPEPGAFLIEPPPSDSASVVLLDATLEYSGDPDELFRLSADSSLIIKLYVNDELVLANDAPSVSARRHSRFSSSFRLLPGAPGNRISILILIPPSGSESLSLRLSPADPSRHFRLRPPSFD